MAAATVTKELTYPALGRVASGDASHRSCTWPAWPVMTRLSARVWPRCAHKGEQSLDTNPYSHQRAACDGAPLSESRATMGTTALLTTNNPHNARSTQPDQATPVWSGDTIANVPHMRIG